MQFCPDPRLDITNLEWFPVSPSTKSNLFEKIVRKYSLFSICIREVGTVWQANTSYLYPRNNVSWHKIPKTAWFLTGDMKTWQNSQNEC